MSLEKMQKSRIKAAEKITEAYNEIAEREVRSDVIAAHLVETYMETGKGDEYDAMSTIIDAIADLGYAWSVSSDKSVDFAEVARQVKAGDPSSFESELIMAFKSAYHPAVKGYSVDHDFNDLVQIASDHIGVETSNDDDSDYGYMSLA